MINEMKLSKQQIENLDNVKLLIESLESEKDRLQIKLETAYDLEEETEKIERALGFIFGRIQKEIAMTAEYMKVDFGLCVDLIFDREYTLKKLSN